MTNQLAKIDNLTVIHQTRATLRILINYQIYFFYSKFGGVFLLGFYIHDIPRGFDHCHIVIEIIMI